MVRRVVIATLLFFAFATLISAADFVTFEGATITGDPLMLTGELSKPQGEGPFAAVVLLHGCSGMFSKDGRNRYDAWVSRLVSWGYVTLQVDSLGPRDKTNICGSVLSVNPLYERMPDAYAGKSYLASQSYVDDKRIAVMGWSHGGSTTLYTVDNIHLGRIRSDPFKAAIAFYPWCLTRLLRVNAPLLILIGEKDDWTPAYRCKNMLLELDEATLKIYPDAHHESDKESETAYEVTLKIYPGAHHGFDKEGIDKKVEGHQIKYDPAAVADAIVQVKEFLARHLQ